MGWRDRDYAKFRKDEFDAIYGRRQSAYSTGTTSDGTSRMGHTVRRRRLRSGFLRALKLPVIAVVGTAALLGGAIATGKVNELNSIGHRTPSPVAVVPQVQLPLRIVGPVSHRSTRIAGTRLLQYGSMLTLSDSHTAMTGNIVVSGRWNSGRWETFAVARGTRRMFKFRIPLDRRGVLRLRIAYPDGGRAVGTYQVR